MRTGDNIRQRSDGRYEARYIKRRDPSGRAVYASCYGRTYEEAARKREEALRRSIRVREMKLLILGAGSHGQEVRELAQRLNVFREIAFLDDDPTKAGVLGPCAGLDRWVEEWPVAIPAVGNRALRMRWLRDLAGAGFAYRQDIVDLLHIQPKQCTLVLHRMVEEGALVQLGQKYFLPEREKRKAE